MSDNVQENKIEESFADIFAGRSEIQTKQEQTVEDATEEVVQEETEQKSVEDEEAKPSTPKESEDSIKAEYELLKKQLNDAKTWGHKKNAAYVHAKKKITEFLSKLQEDSLVNEEDVNLALTAFQQQEYDEQPTSQKDNSYTQVKANLDKEFAVFKKYNKASELDEKYQAFFGFFPLLSVDEQEKIVNYIQEETAEVVIDHIITTGSDIYDTVYKGATKSGGIIPFIKSLHAQIEKLEKRNKELESEVDTIEGTLHNRSISSKVLNLAKTQKDESFADIWHG